MRRNMGERWLLLQFLLCALQPIPSIADINSSCNGFEMVSRNEWLARPYFRKKVLKTPVNIVIIGHTDRRECHSKPQCIRELQFFQDYHLDDRDLQDIGYNFLVGSDGRVYEGRGWKGRGAHTINFNTNSIGIAFMGNFMLVEPNHVMIDSALKLIKCGVEMGYLTPTREIYGHRDVLCTYSPGNKLYDIIRHWDNYKGGRMPKYNCMIIRSEII